MLGFVAGTRALTYYPGRVSLVGYIGRAMILTELAHGWQSLRLLGRWDRCLLYLPWRLRLGPSCHAPVSEALPLQPTKTTYHGLMSHMAYAHRHPGGSALQDSYVCRLSVDYTQTGTSTCAFRQPIICVMSNRVRSPHLWPVASAWVRALRTKSSDMGAP